LHSEIGAPVWVRKSLIKFMDTTAKDRALPPVHAWGVQARPAADGNAKRRSANIMVWLLSLCVCVDFEGVDSRNFITCVDVISFTFVLYPPP
jgi:hypothetical protein